MAKDQSFAKRITMAEKLLMMSGKNHPEGTQHKATPPLTSGIPNTNLTLDGRSASPEKKTWRGEQRWLTQARREPVLNLYSGEPHIDTVFKSTSKSTKFGWKIWWRCPPLLLGLRGKKSVGEDIIYIQICKWWPKMQKKIGKIFWYQESNSFGLLGPKMRNCTKSNKIHLFQQNK